jgi:hypothetical protein
LCSRDSVDIASPPGSAGAVALMRSAVTAVLAAYSHRPGFWPDRADDADSAQKEICPREAEAIGAIPRIDRRQTVKREEGSVKGYDQSRQRPSPVEFQIWENC